MKIDVFSKARHSELFLCLSQNKTILILLQYIYS